MNKENIEKIGNLLKDVAKNNDFSFDIRNPSYNSSYFEVFFEEIKENGKPTHYDKFSDKLAKFINIEDNNMKNAIENFQNVWNGWVELYRQLQKRNLIKADQIK